MMSAVITVKADYESPLFPFIMPVGMMAPTASYIEPFTAAPPENYEPESVSVNLENIILNEFVDVAADDTADILETPAQFSKPENTDPEEAVRKLLEKLIEELKYSNNGKHVIKDIEARVLNSAQKIQLLLKKTMLLLDLDISKLDTVEKTTCFLINLTNLMWIHALLSADEDIRKGLIFTNWALRHIIFNSVGYNVGELGFVSLYDLHSSLFNFPPTFRTNTLSSLTYSTDSRVHFLIAQPYVFSPKIIVVDPDSLELQLERSQDDYLQKFVMLKEMNLLITVPLLLYIERVTYDRDSESEMINNSNGVSEKLSWLIEVLREKNLPYEKLLSKEVYMLNETEFRIRFSYSVYDTRKIQNFNRTAWRCCRIHRSLYHCLMHHTSLARSTMLEDHYSDFLCRDSDKTSNQVCLNNTLFKISKIFYPLYRELRIGADYSHKGQRCLYTVLSFMVGGTRYSDMMLIQPREFSHILEIVKTVFLNVPTADICRKIQMCLKIIVNENDTHMKWPKWFNLFFADPSEVLSDLVERRNASLACEWVAIQSAFDPAYVFSAEVYSKFLAWLCEREDTSFLRQAIEHMHEIPMEDVINFLIKSECSVSRLINLVSAVIGMDSLNEAEQIKFHNLLIGLKMTSCIPRGEQAYYFEIAHSPILIVEQLILNKKIALLKEVLAEVTPSIRLLPQISQKTQCISINEIDELLKAYAEKALHFRKKTLPANRKHAAMLHAFIFKDNDDFHPPSNVPSEEDWIPNNWAVVCLCCRKEFSVFTRRHHCRRCGRVVCNSCSSKRMNISTYKSPQRVCEQCFKFEKQYETPDDSSSLASDISGEDSKEKPPVWRLNMDPESNDVIRNEAAFDTAPDIELCLSLLELHSESIAVPRLLFTKGKEMLTILRQRWVSPANFDYPEVTHIVRSLLLAAKVYYMYLGEMQGARSCEELTSETDMLNQFAKHKFSPPEPNKPIRDIKDWRQIRQVLLEQQNWEPALEISTKNGLECGSIWYLWGMNLLKSGDWAGAREKFLRSNLKKNNSLLADVLEIIFASVPGKETPKRFAKLFQSNPKKSTALPDKVYEECLYYLKTYGTGEQLFDFYVKHERILDAIHTALTKNVSPKSFLKQVYLPYLKNNEQDKVLKYMEAADPTLSGWKDFVHEICIHCSGNKHFEALYEVQLWMKDYCRAAISSTIFYKKGAKSYADLAKNKEHLNNAISHFKMALDRFTNQEKNDLVKVIDPQKITKHVNTIQLQLELMNIICCNPWHANLQFESIPTLFGRDSEKLDLIVLIFSAAKNMESAFDLCQRLVSEYSLNAITIYGKVAQTWMESGKENSVVELIKYVAQRVPEPDSIVDNIACVAVRAKPKTPDVFIDSIKDEVLKFEMCIEAEFLKSAYVLAVKSKRMDFVEKVLSEAKRLNKPAIERICASKLSIRTSIAETK